MKIKFILGMFILIGLSSCTPDNEVTTVGQQPINFEVTGVKADVNVTETNATISGWRAGRDAANTSFSLELGKNGFDVDNYIFEAPILRHNLSGSPYHLRFELVLKTNNPEVPQITVLYEADFERPMRYNENYRMPVTIVLDPSVTNSPGNTGGNVGFSFKDTSNDMIKGFGFNAELEIKIGEETASGGDMEFNLIGDFVNFYGNKPETNVGSLNVQVKGKNLIDLGFF